MTSRRIFITGTAGFIGFHLARLLLEEGWTVCGFDSLNDYYDVSLKKRRHQMLLQNQRFSTHIATLEEPETLQRHVRTFQPDVIVHLAGQAGVRYSIENPRAYLDSNLAGAFNLLEAAREAGVAHLLLASTSSVYGANTEMPFSEQHHTRLPTTFYAATKKANEVMAHSYAHLWRIPTTMFRFFTVYGPWGRPDMALFKFTKGILEGTPIDVYNNGQMYRDFTYVDDLVRGIQLLIDTVPPSEPLDPPVPGDSLSPAAPYRIVNVGNSQKVALLDFVDAIEAEVGKSAIQNYLPMQPGEVPATWADASLLQALTGYRPNTDLKTGVRKFVAWYRDYYGI